MRQRGSRRVRPRAASNDGSSVDPSSMLELTSGLDQLADATTKKNSDANENVTESNDDVAATAREYLHCLNERRTKSERYFLLLLGQISFS